MLMGPKLGLDLDIPYPQLKPNTPAAPDEAGQIELNCAGPAHVNFRDVDGSLTGGCSLGGVD